MAYVVGQGISDDRRGGDDRPYGTGGEDVLDGGSGADLMRGGEGDDLHVVDNNADRVVEGVAQGYDWIETSIASYLLPDNFEGLTFRAGGIAAGFEGRGNELE